MRCGKNNWLFSLVLRRGYAYYKKIGTRRLVLRRVEVTPIDELHHLVMFRKSIDAFQAPCRR